MKSGSDTVGITLGLLTIPMAVLSIASIAAGVLLLVSGDWAAMLFGVAAILFCSALARLLEQVVIAIDHAAALALARGHRGRAYGTASISGALPVLVIFAAEILSLCGVLERSSAAPGVLHWLWGYGVATCPWSLYAERVSRFRRTLVGVRAYAGHVALWLFGLLTLWLDASPTVIVAVLLVPAALPFTLGLVLALSDREAIANVRV
ncbi:hypothetical protein [Sphingomonas sp. PB4P5]|uniref:hypothetical protein n=1 Tax=Parasphingomonas puruogangriensis TaxID=3096155 RepID=UPI002FCBAC4D